METRYIADAQRTWGRPGSVFALVLALVAALSLALAGSASAFMPPTATTSSASNVSYSSAVLYGYVNAKGSATNYYFEYGTTSAYGAQSPLSPAGSATSTVKISQAIAGLQAATKYHYRLVAMNGRGTREGRDRTYSLKTKTKTKAKKSKFELPKTFQPTPLGGVFILSGTLTGTDESAPTVPLPS